jgi:hypothetical protein
MGRADGPLGVAADAAAFAAGASSIRPTTAPMATVSPSRTAIRSTPAAGAATSVEALSVSSSKSGSSAATAAPSFFSQRASVPSVIDSPTDGTLISTGMTGTLMGGQGWRPSLLTAAPAGLDPALWPEPRRGER